MSMTDPIADLLTRVRNGLMARHKTVDVPASKMKAEIARILAEEGYLSGYELVQDGRQGVLRLQLKYGSTGEKVITGLERVSRPGRRVYCGKGEIPRVLGGLGITILSTPKGVLTGTASQRAGVGGEVLCNVW
ncbi:MAG TPA: 30S ribosomal protein S8 [Candidatus Polarisedimenticolaceae bacterium]|nr:30S ribosomal protein S8 [Candidatus Polarisedimenticolaceae bacterium]